MSAASQPDGAPRRLVVWGPQSQFVLTLVAALFAADQALKLFVLYGLDLPAKGRIPLLPFFDLTMVWNRGISYGLFQQRSAAGQYALIGFSIVASVLLWLWAARATARRLALALALIIGGALGNALDRALYGAVADFAHIFVGDWSWYVFNLADAAIVAGALLLVYDSLVGDYGKNRRV